MFTYPGGFDPSAFAEPFSSTYRSHLKRLKLKGLQPKTIDAYARTIRRTGDYFDHQIDNLSPAQLTDYFHDLVASHSWSAVKIDLYGFKFYTLSAPIEYWPLGGADCSLEPSPSATGPDLLHDGPRADAGCLRLVWMVGSPPAWSSLPLPQPSCSWLCLTVGQHGAI